MLNIRHPRLVVRHASDSTRDTTTESELETNPITTSILLSGGLDSSGFPYNAEPESREYSWLDDGPEGGLQGLFFCLMLTHKTASKQPLSLYHDPSAYGRALLKFAHR